MCGGNKNGGGKALVLRTEKNRDSSCVCEGGGSSYLSSEFYVEDHVHLEKSTCDRVCPPRWFLLVQRGSARFLSMTICRDFSSKFCSIRRGI